MKESEGAMTNRSKEINVERRDHPQKRYSKKMDNYDIESSAQ